jgi:quercetin dioxygenase-like cupin family protein
MSPRTRKLVAVLSVNVVGLAGTALATDPIGQTLNLLARGSSEQLDAEHDGIELESRGPVDVAVATVTFAANGGSSCWHHHPGLVVVVVKSGEVTFYDKKCRSEVHKAGDVFVETSDAPGLAKNHGAVDAVVQATFIVPASTPPAPRTPLRRAASSASRTVTAGLLTGRRQ